MTVPSSTKLTPAAQPTARKRAYNTQAQPAPQAVRQWLPQSVLSRLALAVRSEERFSRNAETVQ